MKTIVTESLAKERGILDDFQVHSHLSFIKVEFFLRGKPGSQPLALHLSPSPDSSTFQSLTNPFWTFSARSLLHRPQRAAVIIQTAHSLRNTHNWNHLKQVPNLTCELNEWRGLLNSSSFSSYVTRTYRILLFSFMLPRLLPTSLFTDNLRKKKVIKVAQFFLLDSSSMELQVKKTRFYGVGWSRQSKRVTSVVSVLQDEKWGGLVAQQHEYA